MAKNRTTSICIALVAFLSALSGCDSIKYLYSPKEQMVILQSHNHFLEIGPCGAPWNYDDQINIFMPADSGRCDASQLEAYQNGKLKIESGYVTLDRTHQTITVDLTFEGFERAEHVPVKCKYNGIHKYIERDPQQGEVTRKWLEDFFRNKGTTFYEP